MEPYALMASIFRAHRSSLDASAVCVARTKISTPPFLLTPSWMSGNSAAILSLPMTLIMDLMWSLYQISIGQMGLHLSESGLIAGITEAPSSHSRTTPVVVGILRINSTTGALLLLSLHSTLTISGDQWVGPGQVLRIVLSSLEELGRLGVEPLCGWPLWLGRYFPTYWVFGKQARYLPYSLNRHRVYAGPHQGHHRSRKLSLSHQPRCPIDPLLLRISYHLGAGTSWSEVGNLVEGCQPVRCHLSQDHCHVLPGLSGVARGIV